jgi:hypothetical protein
VTGCSPGTSSQGWIWIHIKFRVITVMGLPIGSFLGFSDIAGHRREMNSPGYEKAPDESGLVIS